MATSSIVVFDQTGGPQGMMSGYLVTPETLLEGDPDEKVHEFFQTPGGSFSAGVWRCTPCTEQIEPYPVHEFMHILDGRVAVTDDDDVTHEFGPGDGFLIRKGGKIRWQIIETVTKWYVAFEGD